MREAAPTCSDSLCDNSSCVLDDSKIGSADMDIIEMEIYDKYRKLDGHEYPHMYLKKCRNKLIAKVKQCRENIHNLEIELAQTKWKSALEKKELGSFMTSFHSDSPALENWYLWPEEQVLQLQRSLLI